jgi:hypothetical protein
MLFFAGKEPPHTQQRIRGSGEFDFPTNRDRCTSVQDKSVPSTNPLLYSIDKSIVASPQSRYFRNPPDGYATCPISALSK